MNYEWTMNELIKIDNALLLPWDKDNLSPLWLMNSSVASFREGSLYVLLSVKRWCPEWCSQCSRRSDWSHWNPSQADRDARTRSCSSKDLDHQFLTSSKFSIGKKRRKRKKKKKKKKKKRERIGIIYFMIYELTQAEQLTFLCWWTSWPTGIR